MSKELKALETEFKEKINAIENAQLKIHKFEKAWKIIKEKDVNFYYLSNCHFTGDYNYKVAEYMRLTKQEFELVKEMLEND